MSQIPGDRSAPTGDRAPTKRAAEVADRIVTEIIGAGWPDGLVLGSETDLWNHHGVSKGVFREAVRILEHRQVARMQKGPGGGLVVTVPTVDSVIDAVVVHLTYVGATRHDVADTRRLLVGAAAELAARRLTEQRIRDLRALAAVLPDATQDSALHAAIASSTDNAAIVFVVDVVERLASRYGIADECADTAEGVIDAIVSGDGATARAQVHRRLPTRASTAASDGPRTTELFVVPGRGERRADAAAQQLFEEVLAEGWQTGRNLGSEADLTARLGVSRSVLREAVGILDHHGVVRMRRGPGGGLLIHEPGIDATIEAVALHLERRALRVVDLMEFREIIEMQVLERAMARLDDDAIRRLQAAVELEHIAVSQGDSGFVGHDIHSVLAALAGNPVLQVLVDVTVRVSYLRGFAAPTASSAMGSLGAHHDGILDGIVAGDLDIARHRMRRHLKDLTRWVRDRPEGLRSENGSDDAR